METQRIIEQMRRAHNGEPWVGVSLADLLDDLTWVEAEARPIPSAHSIWEIVLHLITTQQLIVDLVGGVSRAFHPGDDWPAVERPSESSWADVMRQFREGEAAVRQAASTIDGDRLDRPLREGGSSAYNNLHGYVQHALYHAGQISLLKKLARNERKEAT